MLFKRVVNKVFGVSALTLSGLVPLPTLANIDIEECRQFTHEFADQMVAENGLKFSKINELVKPLLKRTRRRIEERNDHQETVEENAN